MVSMLPLSYTMHYRLLQVCSVHAKVVASISISLAVFQLPL